MISPLVFVLFSLSTFSSVSSATSGHQSDLRQTSRSIPFQARSNGVRTTILSRDNRDNGGTTINLTNLADLAYFGQVSVGGQELSLDIDTGSSDLWVKVPVMTTKRTDVEVNLTYGVGSAAGKLVFGPICIGAYCVPEQIFLDVDSMTAPENQAKTGLIGLGFPTLSLLYTTANASNITTNALPPIYNIFNQNSSLPRFIGLALERSDSEHTAGGHLTIGEHFPDFSDVERSEKHLLSPSNTSRWTILLNGISMNGKNFDNLTSNSVTPGGAPVALIDSGTSLAYIPHAAVDFIYGNIPGAVSYKDGIHGWMVPCLQPANLTFTFGGETFSIDPLEITQVQTMIHAGREWTICVNTINPQVNPYGSGLDYVLGDIFMRNVYSVFNYGDISSNYSYNPAGSGASIQFLSRTNQFEAMQKFATQRSETLKSLPPLFDIGKMDGSGSWSARSFDN